MQHKGHLGAPREYWGPLGMSGGVRGVGTVRGVLGAGMECRYSATRRVQVAKGGIGGHRGVGAIRGHQGASGGVMGVLGLAGIIGTQRPKGV